MKALILSVLILSVVGPPVWADRSGHASQHTTPIAMLRDRAQSQPAGPASVPSRNGWNINAVDAIEAGFPEAACVVGNYAYVGFTDVISIFDVTNPASPVKVGFALTPGRAVEIRQHGNYLYCGNYPESFLQIFDITNPIAPSLVASIPIDGYRLDVEGNYLYAVDGLGVRVYDVSTPASPNPIGYIASTGVYAVYDVDASGGYLYVGRNNGLQIVDVTNPASPIERSTLPVVGAAYALAAVSSSYVYLVTFFAPPALRVVDVSNPLAPSVVKTVPAGDSFDISVQGNYAYLLDGGEGGYLRVFNISDPLNPVGLPPFSPCDMYAAACLGVGNGIAIVGDYGDGGMCVVDVLNPASPVSRSHYESLQWPHSVDVSGDRLLVSLEYGPLASINRYDASMRTIAFGHGGWIDGSQVVVRGNHAYVGMSDSQFGDSDGLEIFDISDATHPVSVGHLDTPWFPQPLAVGASHVYLATYEGLWVVDVSSPTLPTKVGQLAISTGDLFASEPYLFTTGPSSLRVLDVSNPTLPVVVANLPLGGNPYGLSIANSFAFVAAGTAMWVVDVSDPLHPSLVGNFPTTQAWRIRVREKFAYLDDYPFLRILDVSNATLPVEVGNIETSGISSQSAVAPPYIYAVTDDYTVLVLETPLITDVRAAPRARLALQQNYPNPFNPSTTIAFETPANGHVRLDVFDVRGGLVRRLVDESMPAGAHSIVWDGRDSDGNVARSGVYFYRLEANGKSEAKKMVILK